MTADTLLAEMDQAIEAFGILTTWREEVVALADLCDRWAAAYHDLRADYDRDDVARLRQAETMARRIREFGPAKYGDHAWRIIEFLAPEATDG